MGASWACLGAPNVAAGEVGGMGASCACLGAPNVAGGSAAGGTATVPLVSVFATALVP